MSQTLKSSSSTTITLYKYFKCKIYLLWFFFVMPIKINFMSPAANRTRDLCVRVLSQFDTHKAMRAVTSILCRLPCQCQYRTNTSTGDNIYNNNILYFGLRIRWAFHDISSNVISI
uniref:Uncharacterized protein n=1 Tax=Cacopsylla melanoneura TaxID=428564 RepID=A0A8D8XJK8_9HEMI